MLIRAGRNVTILIGTMAALLAGVVSANAQSTFYVRAGATGAGTGADWAEAYTRLPATMVRGATYYIAAGTYSGPITFNTPVSGATYINIKKATAAAHGTDTGWDSSYGSGVAAFSGAWTFTTGYWDIDGVTGGGPGSSVLDWPGSWTSNHGISQSVGAFASNIDLNASQNVRGLRFRHLKLINGTPVNNTTTSYGNVFHAEFGSIPRASDVVVEYVYIPDFQGAPFHVKEADDWLVQYSYFEGNGIGNHANVHRELWSGIANDRWVWRWNYVQNIVNTAVWALVNGGGITDSVEIYGNIVTYTPGRYSGLLIDASDTGVEPVAPNNWRVFNNTVVGWTESGPLVWLGAGSNTYFRNNIYANMQTTYGPDVDVVYKSHNAVYNIIRTGQWAGDETSAWAAALGSNSQTFSSDPFVNYYAGDFRLKAATSPGSTAGSPAGNAVDMFGHPRGLDGVWDRGALEYVVSRVTGPAAPTNVQIVR